MRSKKGFAFIIAEQVVTAVAVIIILIVFSFLVYVDIQYNIELSEIKTNTELKRVALTLSETPTDVFIQQINLGTLITNPTLAQKAVSSLQEYQTVGMFLAAETDEETVCGVLSLIEDHPLFKKYSVQLLRENVDPWSIRATKSELKKGGSISTTERKMPFYTLSLPSPTKSIKHIRIIEKSEWKDAGGIC